MTEQQATRLNRRQAVGATVAAAAAGAVAGRAMRPAFAAPRVQSGTAIEYWHPPHGADPDAEKEFLDGLIAEFEAENAGVTVNLTMIPWGDIYQKWTTAIAAGAPPDVSISGSEAAIQFAAEGHLLPVSAIVEGLGGEDAHWDTLPYFFYDGDYWQVPYIDGAWVLYSNPAMLQDLGFEGPPATWEELKAIATEARAGDIYGLPLSFSRNYTPNQAYMCLQSAWGVGALSPDGEVQMTAPGMAELTDFYVSFQRDGLTPPDALTWTGNDEALAYLANGKAPLAVGYGNRVEKIIADAEANGVEVGVSNMPLGPGDRPGSYGATNGHMIFAKAKNPELAAQFIEFIHQPERLPAWSKLTGWLPPLREAADSPELDAPGLNAMRDQLAAGAVVRNGYAFGGHPANGLVEGQLMFADMIQEIAVVGVPVEDALADYQGRLEALYNEEA